MKSLLLHGWQSVPGGVKPTSLARHGHEVLNPKLPDEDTLTARAELIASWECGWQRPLPDRSLSPGLFQSSERSHQPTLPPPLLPNKEPGNSFEKPWQLTTPVSPLLHQADHPFLCGRLRVACQSPRS
jgi:hypothetical protein